MANFKPNTNVTLLHKGLGPTLFQYRSRPLPIGDLNSRGETPRCSPRGCDKPPRRIVVKCIDRQDENTMFSKRLQARDKSKVKPRVRVASGVSAGGKKMRDNDPFMREKMFTTPTHKLDSFPPPSFLPRWNPRHRDRTYLDKVVLDDPWMLPKEKRIELQRKTGLRLKSMSRHYQFKVAANLPFGKDALVPQNKCTCYINFCDHCSKDHTYRCPLHMQLLEGGQADCKTEIAEACPFRRQPEDLPLKKIKDAKVYVSEVVRRLRAGEIQEVPPFPQNLLVDDKAKKLDKMKNLKQAAVESSSALDLGKKVHTESSFAQTEPFMVDVDMSNGIKDNVCQTMKPPLDEPLLTTKMKPLRSEMPFISYGNNEEASTQVTPFEIVAFHKIAGKFSRTLVSSIMQQALREVRDEAVIADIQKEAAGHIQQLAVLQRSQHFRLMQEQFRNAAYGQDEYAILHETWTENDSETNLGAILFSQVFFRGFAEKAMDSLRSQGVLVNEDLMAIQSTLKEEFNSGVADKLDSREHSIKLLDEITRHALFDLEIDYFMRNMVDDKYLHPTDYTSRQLMDMIRMRDENMKTIEKIKKLLIQKGWQLNEEGMLYNINSEEEQLLATTESDESLDAFLKKVRVSVDSDGNPKYLVDSMGRALPINVVWLPYLTSTMGTKDAHGKSIWDPTKTFDIVLSEKSFSTITDPDQDEVAEGSDSEVSSEERRRRSSSRGPDLGEIDISFDDQEEQGEGDGSDEDEAGGKMIFKLASKLFKEDA